MNFSNTVLLFTVFINILILKFNMKAILLKFVDTIRYNLLRVSILIRLTIHFIVRELIYHEKSFFPTFFTHFEIIFSI